MEDSLNDMHKFKSSACALDDGQEKDWKINLINDAIARLGNDLTLLREKQSAEISFKAQARWLEHGKKSN